MRACIFGNQSGISRNYFFMFFLIGKDTEINRSLKLIGFVTEKSCKCFFGTDLSDFRKKGSEKRLGFQFFFLFERTHATFYFRQSKFDVTKVVFVLLL